MEKNENRIISEFLASRKLDHKPKIAIITPLYNAPSKYFRECVRSVLAQTYENWELCIHNDASTMYLENITYIQKLVQRDPRIKFSTSDTNQNISGSTNSALKLTDADYFILLDNDDALHPQALQVIVSELNRDPDIKYIYTDEDKMEPEGSRTEPILKPDWAPHFLLSMMYTTHISLFRTDLVRKIGGFRIGFEGSQDYDLVLRYTESLNRNEISHIPIPLYHWRKIPGSTAVSYEAKGQAKMHHAKHSKRQYSGEVSTPRF
ncbi:glycosyltransferase [Candidatus Nomurabacteria bacterium]|nr:glycosyltransferase [Candidatus Nomurabacteria bacterium]